MLACRLFGTGTAGNMMSTGSPHVGKGKLRAFLEIPLQKKLGNYST